MSEHVTINGKKFLPSAMVAREFGYTLDYVSRLAREDKVEATRVGRVWFVEPTSLSSFVAMAEIKKKAAREELRERRKQEHREHVTVHTKTKAVPVANVPAALPTERVRIVIAAVGSGLVMVAGLLFSAVLVPEDVLEFVVALEPKKNVAHTADTEQAAGAWLSTEGPVAAPNPTESPKNSNGLVVFDERQDKEQLERIREQFSDEVEIRMEGENHGVITPVFKGRTGDEYQFLMVPVTDPS